jgi:hypothetical protein
MYTDNGKKTIYDDVKPRKIVSVDIPEFNETKTNKHFDIKHLSLDNLENYNTTSFPKFDIVQDNELFNLWGFGDVEMMSLNPEYKYKYPKLTKSEFMKQEWQTQQGVPNKLNIFLRAEEAGTSIQDIKALDDDYEEGLLQLYKNIDREAGDIQKALNSDGKNDVILTEAQKNHLKEAETELKEAHKKMHHIAKHYNPVHIRSASIANKEQHQQKIKRETSVMQSIKEEPVFLKKVKEPKLNSSELQQALLQKEIKNGKLLNPTSQQRNHPKPLSTDLTPEQIEQNKEAFKKAIAEGKQNLKSSEKEPDDNTFNVPQGLKSTLQKALLILNDPFYKDKPGSYNMFSDEGDRNALNTLNKALDKIQGKKPGTNDVRTLKTLREKFHINEKIVYNESHSKQTHIKKKKTSKNKT